MGSSQSLETSATKSAYSIGASMVFCNSGLSFFDHPVNRENRNVVVNLLQDLKMSIIAVWLVARPINRSISGSFEHWCVKIQAKGCLISIDFLESSGKGAYGLQQRTDIGGELEDFLYYAVIDPHSKHKTRHKWQIISSITPHPFRNSEYLNYLSDHDRLKLEEYIKNSKISASDPSKFMQDIKCNRRVCDIADFCNIWTEDGKGYNAITKNCQKFAAELYAYLIYENYKEEVIRVFDRYQSPYDRKQWKTDKVLTNNLQCTTSLITTPLSHSLNEDDKLYPTKQIQSHSHSQSHSQSHSLSHSHSHSHSKHDHDDDDDDDEHYHHHYRHHHRRIKSNIKQSSSKPHIEYLSDSRQRRRIQTNQLMINNNDTWSELSDTSQSIAENVVSQ